MLIPSIEEELSESIAEIVLEQYPDGKRLSEILSEGQLPHS